MEDVYQDYKDSISFVWVYQEEAHPAELPFLFGFETKNLGWDHPYTNTITMEERAQRLLQEQDGDAGIRLAGAPDGFSVAIGSRRARVRYRGG